MEYEGENGIMSPNLPCDGLSPYRKRLLALGDGKLLTLPKKSCYENY